LAHVARTIGLTSWLRHRYERPIIKAGHHHVAPLGSDLVLEVHAPHELAFIDWLVDGETALLKRLVDIVRDGDVVWDVGANVGLVSIAVAVATRGQNVRVHAMEPNPLTAARARRNVAENNCDAVSLHELALGLTAGPALLHANPGAPQLDSTLAPLSPAANTFSVQMERADSLADTLRLAPTVMKIDVEGAELDVLNGCDRLLRSGCLRDVFVEVHCTRLTTIGRHKDDVVSLLLGKGYRLIWDHARQDDVQYHFRRHHAG
jgi:FkbM family methyltransferase